jgi:3'-5' exoribonuclease
MFQRNDAVDVAAIEDQVNVTSLVLERKALENVPVNSPINASALIVRAELRHDRGNRPYVAMTLQCAGGATIEARWWHFPHPPADCPMQGEVYRITGFLDVFNGERQLRIMRADHIPDADIGPFVKLTHQPLAELLSEFDEVSASLDNQMHALLRSVLHEGVFGDFRDWPAAHRRHGAVRHGLLAHSLRVADLVQRIADTYGMDGLAYDRSLAVAAALLHDIGKLRTLPAIAGAAIPATANLYDHVTLSVLAVERAAHLLDEPLPADRLDNLLHAILAHHGRQEWGAAREPHTVEAWLVHLADLAESRLWAYANEEAQPRNVPSDLA